MFVKLTESGDETRKFKSYFFLDWFLSMLIFVLIGLERIQVEGRDLDLLKVSDRLTQRFQLHS